MTSAIHFLSLAYLSIPSKAKIKIDWLYSQHIGQLEPLQSPSDLIQDLFLYCGLREAQQGHSYTTRHYEVVDMRINLKGSEVWLELFNPCSCEAGDGKHCLAHNNGPISLGFAGNVDNFISMIPQHLRLGNGLKELRVTHSDRWQQTAETEDPSNYSSHPVGWRSFFARHPSLRRITLDSKEEDVRDILNALAPTPENQAWDPSEETQASVISLTAPADLQVDRGRDSSMTGDPYIPLPSLQALKFSDGVLGGTNTGPGNYLALESMLASRAKHGKGVPFIRLSTSPPADSGDNEMLAKICQINGRGDVIWG